MSVGGRAGGWRGTVNDAIVAALDGRAVYGEIEGRHLEGALRDDNSTSRKEWGRNEKERRS